MMTQYFVTLYSSYPLSGDAGVVLNKKTNMLQACKRRTLFQLIVPIIESINFTLNGLISPGVEGQGMGQDL